MFRSSSSSSSESFKAQIAECLHDSVVKPLDAQSLPLSVFRCEESLQEGLFPATFLFQEDILKVLSAIHDGPIGAATGESPAYLLLKSNIPVSSIYENENTHMLITYLQHSLSSFIDVAPQGHARMVCRQVNPEEFSFFIRLKKSKSSIAEELGVIGCSLPIKPRHFIDNIVFRLK